MSVYRDVWWGGFAGSSFIALEDHNGFTPFCIGILIASFVTFLAWLMDLVLDAASHRRWFR